MGLCVCERESSIKTIEDSLFFFLFFIYEIFKCLITLLFCCAGRILARCVARGDVCLHCKQGFYPDPAPELVHTLCACEPQGPLLNLLAEKQVGTQDLTLTSSRYMDFSVF